VSCFYQPASAYKPTDAADLRRHYGRLFAGKRKPPLVVRKLKPAVPAMFVAITPTRAAASPQQERDFMAEAHAEIARHTRYKIADVVRAVSAATGVSVNDMVSPRRIRRVCEARQVAYFVARTMTARSLPEIGRAFGNKNHTTILHGIRKVERNAHIFAPVAARAIAILEGTGK
jgi:chromosomal replication initiation ATPase DnaA